MPEIPNLTEEELRDMQKIDSSDDEEIEKLGTRIKTRLKRMREIREKGRRSLWDHLNEDSD